MLTTLPLLRAKAVRGSRRGMYAGLVVDHHSLTLKLDIAYSKHASLEFEYLPK